MPASRWSSLRQSECLDCPSCPVGGGVWWKQWWENPALSVVPPIHFHTLGARWREGGAINHFSLCKTKKALAVNGVGYSSVLSERFLSRWQIQQPGSWWEEMKSQGLLVMQTDCSQGAAHCWWMRSERNYLQTCIYIFFDGAQCKRLCFRFRNGKNEQS